MVLQASGSVHPGVRAMPLGAVHSARRPYEDLCGDRHLSLPRHTSAGACQPGARLRHLEECLKVSDAGKAKPLLLVMHETSAGTAIHVCSYMAHQKA